MAYLVVLLAMLSVPVMAASGGGGATSTDPNEPPQWTFGQGKFTFLQDYTMFDIAVRINPAYSNTLNFDYLRELGFYRIPADGSQPGPEDYVPVWIHKNDGTGLTGHIQHNDPATFHKDDQIGLYIKSLGYGDNHGHWISDPKDYARGISYDENGIITFITTEVPSNTPLSGSTVFEHNQNPSVSTIVDEEGNQTKIVYFSLFYHNVSNNQITFGYALSIFTNIDDIGEYDYVGQPLPGLLLSLAIGGLPVAGAIRKRRKAKAKAIAE